MSLDLALSLEPRQCPVCHTCAGLDRCSGGCNMVFYCGREHQDSDRARHEQACTVINEGVADRDHAHEYMRSELDYVPFIGVEGGQSYILQDHFVVPDTPVGRVYWISRCVAYQDMIANFNNVDAVQMSLDHLIEDLVMINDHRNLMDKESLCEVIPALYLRLGRDLECYGFIKTKQEIGLPYSSPQAKALLRGNETHHDVFESPVGVFFLPDKDLYCPPSHIACVTLIKVRILLDLQHMQNATRAFQAAAPQEIIDEIRCRALVSSVVASTKEIRLASSGRIAELIRTLKGQIRALFNVVARFFPTFWPTIVGPTGRRGIPDPYLYGQLCASKGQAARDCGPNDHSWMDEAWSEAFAWPTYESWRETPGAIELIESLMKVA